MSKNILIINSSKDKNRLLSDLFDELNQKNYSFFLLSSRPNLINQFRKNNWPAKKINLGPSLKNNISPIIFIIILFFLYFKVLAKLIRYKINKKIQLIICLNWNEKIIVTPLAKMIGLKTCWLELPDADYKNLGKPLLWLYRLNANWATVIAFNSQTKTNLENLMIAKNKIKIIQPGIKISQYQENIFNKLAKNDWRNSHRKYFTIGTIADLNQKQKIETILQSVKICLTIIPNMQLIIIGEGKEKKNLTWLSKKMEIDNLVWFVGEQGQLKKWLSGFDIFIVTTNSPNIDDYSNILQAMAAGLPIIGLRNVGLEDIICENKTGLLTEIDNSEMLAHVIIKMQQNKEARIRLGKNGCDQVNKYLTIEEMTKKFQEILN